MFHVKRNFSLPPLSVFFTLADLLLRSQLFISYKRFLLHHNAGQSLASARPVSHMTHAICITLPEDGRMRGVVTAHGQDGGRGNERKRVSALDKLWTSVFGKKKWVKFSFDMHLQPVIGGSVFKRFSSKGRLMSLWSSSLKS